MKKKIINVTYRKESISFPDWMKYEITILNEDGSETIIPAYGKDLEDALSRVKHDTRVEIVQNTAKKIPGLFWVVMWLLYMSGLTILHYEVDEPMIILGGLSFAGFLVIFVQWWSQTRNVDKK